jgi:hypothetical protein
MSGPGLWDPLTWDLTWPAFFLEPLTWDLTWPGVVRRPLTCRSGPGLRYRSQVTTSVKIWIENTGFSISLGLSHVFLLPIQKKISEQPCSNGEAVRHSVVCEGIRTTHKTIFRVPHGSRPHGHDRRVALCVNDPERWKSTPVLQSPPWPDEDLSIHYYTGGLPTYDISSVCVCVSWILLWLDRKTPHPLGGQTVTLWR